MNTQKNLIVGAGTVGLLTAWHLLAKQIPFEIWYDPTIIPASHAATGLINPITGKRLAKRPDFEPTQQTALAFYENIHQFFKIPFIHKVKYIRTIANDETQQHYLAKMQLPDFQTYLSDSFEFSHPHLNLTIPAFSISRVYRINTALLTDVLLHFFEKHNYLKKQTFSDESPPANFEHIFLCRGPYEKYSPLFHDLVWENAQGESLIFFAPNLNLTHILHHNRFHIVPLNEGYYWSGATYEHEFETPEAFLQPKPEKPIENYLQSLLKVPFQVLQKNVGIRPVLKQRNPVFLQHPIHQNIYLCNGFGSKATLLVPQFLDKYL